MIDLKYLSIGAPGTLPPPALPMLDFTVDELHCLLRNERTAQSRDEILRAAIALLCWVSREAGHDELDWYLKA